MNNELKINTVLWDMDGVLADTGEAHYQAWAATLAEEGIPFNWDLFRQTFGMNNKGILTYLTGSTPTLEYQERISLRKEGAFRNSIHGLVQPLPGVIQWLGRLQTAGYRQAVASSAPQENIEVLVDELGIRGYFLALVSAYAIPGKPDPAVFFEAARRVGASPQECVVIEDSIAGVEAAHRAGMRCIAVTNTNPRAALASADLIVDNLEELTEGVFARL